MTLPTLHTQGVVQDVDTINRELRVAVEGHSLIFRLPVNCIVLLNREQVKLRLLQPADRVNISYYAEPTGDCIARRVEA